MLRIEPFETLLTSLRDRLHLTAAKRGCNQGVCGACSVLIGGEPARACLSLTANCVDRDITTVEGLSTPLALSPLQAAMVRAGAIQCGFCTPGMLITLTALLKERPQPTRQEIRLAVSSNLCRCTGYQKIVEAVVEMVGGGAA
jgi:aerobic carbon-monoxide dehydrogenase small subunit